MASIAPSTASECSGPRAASPRPMSELAAIAAPTMKRIACGRSQAHVHALRNAYDPFGRKFGIRHATISRTIAGTRLHIGACRRNYWSKCDRLIEPSKRNVACGEDRAAATGTPRITTIRPGSAESAFRKPGVRVRDFAGSHPRVELHGESQGRGTGGAGSMRLDAHIDIPREGRS